MTDARTEILARIRSALAGVDADAPPPGTDGRAGPAADVALFVERARAANATVHEVPEGGSPREVVAETLTVLRAKRIAVSSAPDARATVAGIEGEIVQGADERAPLFTCDAGVTGAQAAIAETGSLVLRTDAEGHRLVSLVPEAHVALLERSAVTRSLDDLFRTIEDQGADGADLPRCVTLITGPSRTADIELQLVVGVHGPRELHIVLLD